MSWDGDHDMPRWVVALFLIALGIMGAYQAITSDGAQGNRSAIEQVADAAFYAGYSLFCLAGGIAIWITRSISN